MERSLLAVGGWGYLQAAFPEELIELFADAHRSCISAHELPLQAAVAGSPSAAAQALAQKSQLNSRSIVLGWSLGALLAAEAQSYGLLNARALILIAATPRFISGPDFPWGTPPATLRAMAAALERDRSGVLKRFYGTVLHPERAHESLLELWASAAAEIPERSLVEGLHYLETCDVRGAAPEIRAPVLIIHGEKDEIIPAAAGRELARLIPGARYVEYKGQGHAVAWTETRGVVQTVREFLQDAGN